MNVSYIIYVCLSVDENMAHILGSMRLPSLLTIAV